MKIFGLIKFKLFKKLNNTYFFFKKKLNNIFKNISFFLYKYIVILIEKTKL